MDTGRKNTSTKKKLCPYGKNCYRKNPEHFKVFFHEDGESSPSQTSFEEKTCHQNMTPTKISPKQNQAKLTNYFKRRKLECDQQEDDCDGEQNGKQSTFQKQHIQQQSPCEEAKNNKQKDNKNKMTKDKPTNDDKFIQSTNKQSSNRSLEAFLDDDLDEDLGQLEIPSILPSTIGNNPAQIDKTKFKDLHKKLFLTPLPDEVFLFWEFCQKIHPKKPENAFCETIGIKLVGPFDIFAGKLNEKDIDRENILCHWRYQYDVPEFQTFAIVNLEEDSLKLNNISKEYHLGYFRDIPTEDEPLVVSNDPNKFNCKIQGVADNIFTAFFLILRDKKLKDAKSKNKCEDVINELKSFAQMHKINVESCKKLRQRERKRNAPTLNHFGISVDVKNDVGYRELPETDQNIKKLFERIIKLDDDETRRKSMAVKEIHKIINLINYANDEKDFGMGLEFGIDLFCIGHAFFHRSAEHLLNNAYNFLGRNEFSIIIKSHLNNRDRKYPNLSSKT